jgi:hypothetical protein
MPALRFEFARSLSSALGLVVVLRIEIDCAEGFKDSQLLTVLDVLLKRSGNSFFFGFVFTDEAGFFD